MNQARKYLGWWLLGPALPLLEALTGNAMAGEQRIVNAATPPPECTFRVNFDRNVDMPGYLVEKSGRRACLPFMPTSVLVPADYKGRDFYADEFTDAKIKARWAVCRKDPDCTKASLAAAKAFVTTERRVTGAVDAAAKIDPQGEVDLKSIRRPAYFGRAPHSEPLAEAESRTYTVEFTVPRDAHERLHLGLTDPIKLRGWYIEGTGVDDGAGQKVRALVVMNPGGGGEITAIDNSKSPGTVQDAKGNHIAAKFPDAITERKGETHWRGFIHALNRAGFDVLAVDRRGGGISGGVSAYNTAEQARDIFRQLDQLETGDGLRMLTPSGQVLAGREARGRLLASRKATELPVVLGGYSRGSYTTAWAMHKNFVEDCSHDLPGGGCSAPLRRSNIRGAILYGPNAAGVGYRQSGHDLVEAALRTEFNIMYYPDGGVLANLNKWPALMIARGIWDYVEGLEGSFDAYRRANEPKEIFVFRGPHQFHSQAPENMRLVGERMAAFAKAAVLGRKQVEGASRPASLKDVVASSPDVWDLTTRPRD